MMTLNDNEKKFQEKLQKDTEIPAIVRERANQAYHLIENNTAVQKKKQNDKNALRWMKNRREDCGGNSSSTGSRYSVLRGKSGHGKEYSGGGRPF